MSNDSMRIYSALVESEQAQVANVVNVWSNGKKIRRYQGQDKSGYTVSTSADKGYRKMVAILIEVPEEANANE